MSDGFESVAPEEAPTLNELPPLRIHHFMLWTAVSAVMLTVLKTDAVNNEFATLNTSSIPNLLINSACLTGLGLGLFWKHRGYFFFDEPGQMAFVINGIAAIYALVSTAAENYSALDATAGEANQWVSTLSTFGWAAIVILQLALHFKYARKFAHEEKWANFFYIAGIITLLQYALIILTTFFFFASLGASGDLRLFFFFQATIFLSAGIVEIIFWLIAIRYDLSEETKRHWTHWVGAITWPTFRLLTLVTMLMLLFFFRQ